MQLKEAADALGISKEAVRQRVRRGTIRSEKGEDGRVYVYLDATADAVNEVDEPEDRASALVGELRDRVSYLERQVEEERDARRRADTLLARLMDRVPELVAPSGATEAREPPESPSDKGADDEVERKPSFARRLLSLIGASSASTIIAIIVTGLAAGFVGLWYVFLVWLIGVI